ncbi:pH-response regulator protein palA/rim20 [Sorochytrium milnesiophthora]
MSSSSSSASALSNMLAVEFRRTEAVKLVAPLKQYVRTSYSESDEQYADDFRNLEAPVDIHILRSDMLNLEAHTNALERLIKYYGQLYYVAAKFPINENNIRIAFPWYGSFSKDKRAVNQYHLNFERASIMFDIAAMYSQLGLQEPRTNEEGVKRSCDYFQRSAGAFTYLGDAVTNDLRGFSAPLEMTAQATTCLTNFMLAQAQECVWLKAVSGTMKDGVIARLAMKVSEYYTAACEAVEGSMVAQMPLMQHWMTHMKVKALHFAAAAQYRKAVESRNDTKYGEEIARLREALAKIKTALEKQKYVAAAVVKDIKGLELHIQHALTKAEKDNDIVYLQIVPPIANLPAITGASMVKPTPFVLQEHQRIIGTPVFSKLVSLAAHEMASEYVELKRKTVQADVEQLEKIKASVWSKLGEMGLPGSVAAIEAPDGLPVDMIDHCTEFSQEGGMQYLRNSVETVKSLSESDERLIQEIEIMLENEDNDDKELRAQFKERWQRTPSTQLQTGMKDKLREYRSKLALARRSDGLVRNKIESNIVDLELLQSSRAELERVIPASAIGITVRDPVYVQLKSALGKCEAKVKELDALVSKIKETSEADDIGSTLMDLSSRNQELDKKEVFATQLQRYDVFKQQTKQLEADIQQELGHVTAANSAFTQAKRGSTASREREHALQALDRAYKVFTELRGNCGEGFKFYTDLEKVLTSFREQVRDYCAARSIEKKDLLGELTTSLANMSTGGPPAVPPRPGAASTVPGQWTPGNPLVFQRNPFDGIAPPAYPGHLNSGSNASANSGNRGR